MAIDVTLKDKLKEMDREYGDAPYKLMGPTLLTYNQFTDSTRCYMFTSHLKQFLTLLNPDIPRLSTGFENTFGQYNRAYKAVEGTWEVKDKIRKFQKGNMYMMVLYNAETDTYDMVEKRLTEGLTEKLGYVYNTSIMDNLEPGDTITDQMLYHSTSYDANGNYRYGKNAKVCFSTSNPTLEDSIRIRRSWADGVKTVSVEEVKCPVNDNDIPLNLMGDDEHYKPIPDIGEEVKNSLVFATRRINKNHILFDFQAKNMREANAADTDYYTSKHAILYDMDIYYNKEEPFPDNVFYHQLKGYYDEICEYAQQVADWTKKIKESGSNYTDDIPHYKTKYQHYNNPEYKWEDNGKAFSNMIIKFHVYSISNLQMGSKLSGRYGNKGVISSIINDSEKELCTNLLELMGEEVTPEAIMKTMSSIEIVDDEDMPYTEHFPIDIILNSSGSIRRLNSAQIMEVELNFIAENIRRRVTELETLDEKADLIFKFLSMVNEHEYTFFYDMYRSFDQKIEMKGKTLNLTNTAAKEAFVRDVEEHGFYLVRPPHQCIDYVGLQRLYREFEWIKPYPIYINMFGIKGRRVLKDAVVGDQYMIVLKQNSNKNFSARSTFRVTRANLPAKDNTKKTNRSSYAKTPVNLSELYNLMISVSGTLLSEHNLFVRSSVMARKSLDRILAADGNPLVLKKIKVKDNFINANADILNAHLKTLGTKIVFHTKGMDEDQIYVDAITELDIDGYTIFDTPENKHIYSQLLYYYKKYVRTQRIIETYPGEKQDMAWDYVFSLPEVKDMVAQNEELYAGIKETLLQVTKGKLQNSIITVDKETDYEDESEASDDMVEDKK